ncbi:MAG: AMIN domain-containing protein [Leptolyngbyaceae cyanobacterium]
MQNQQPEFGFPPYFAWSLNPQVNGLLGGMVASLGAAAIVSSPLPAMANSLVEWSFDSTANQLEVQLQHPTSPRYFLMAQPARIILDLPGTRVGSVPTEQTYNGAIRRIRVSQFQPNLARIVLELSPDATLARGQVQLKQIGAQEAIRWQLTPLLVGAVAPVTPPSQPQPSASILSQKPLTLTGPPVVLQTAPAAQNPPPPSVSAGAASIPSVIVPSASAVPSSATGSIKMGDLDIPSTLPITMADRPTIEVPTLGDRGVPALPAQPPSQMVTVPPLVSFTAPSKLAQGGGDQPSAPTNTANQGIIEFGQPLPDRSPTSKPALPPAPPPSMSLAQPPVIQTQPIKSPVPIAPAPGEPQALKSPLSHTLLPTGSILGLRYSAALPLSMTDGVSQQEILLLEAEIRDSQGNLLAPAGSPVVGQFERSGKGSRFVTQSITLRGEVVPLAARSEVLNLTPNKALQPGEVVYVRLLKDLR